MVGVAGGHSPLDVELATLRELPRRGNFVHRTNTLYAAAGEPPDGPTDEEVALLPRIRRHQITLTKFLGSGAFGEVFEGNARNLSDGTVEMRVAIKVSHRSPQPWPALALPTVVSADPTHPLLLPVHRRCGKARRS